MKTNNSNTPFPTRWTEQSRNEKTKFEQTPTFSDSPNGRECSNGIWHLSVCVCVRCDAMVDGLWSGLVAVALRVFRISIKRNECPNATQSTRWRLETSAFWCWKWYKMKIKWVGWARASTQLKPQTNCPAHIVYVTYSYRHTHRAIHPHGESNLTWNHFCTNTNTNGERINKHTRAQLHIAASAYYISSDCIDHRESHVGERERENCCWQMGTCFTRFNSSICSCEKKKSFHIEWFLFVVVNSHNLPFWLLSDRR